MVSSGGAPRGAELQALTGTIAVTIGLGDDRHRKRKPAPRTLRAPSSVVEHVTFNHGVPGSIPGGPTSFLRIRLLAPSWLLFKATPRNEMRCNDTDNSRDVITLVFFQNLGKCRWLPVTR
jgi:hypothetical protein